MNKLASGSGSSAARLLSSYKQQCIARATHGMGQRLMSVRPEEMKPIKEGDVVRKYQHVNETICKLSEFKS